MGLYGQRLGRGPVSGRTAGIPGALRPRGGPHPALRAACDSLSPAFEESGGRHGQVSASLSPASAHDAFAFVVEAAALQRAVQRPNMLVRIPATQAGLAAVSACVARGIGVDATLIFSVGHYGRVLSAYMDGLDLALANGLPLERITLLASFPIGLIDEEVNSRLESVPADVADQLRDTAGVAVAQLIYRAREERLNSTWWRVLRSAGAAAPRLAWIGAGPGHVGALVGSNSVLSLAVDILENVVTDNVLHGDTLLNAHAQGRSTLELLGSHGIDMDVVAEALGKRTCPVEQPL